MTKKYWSRWDGGLAPVDKKTEVKVKMRNGNVSTSLLFQCLHDWMHLGSKGDIVAYHRPKGMKRNKRHGGIHNEA